jgi:hypothetical protein
LEIHYRHTLEELGRRSGMLGVILRKAQNKIQDPAKLRRLIADLIDKAEWSSLLWTLSCGRFYSDAVGNLYWGWRVIGNDGDKIIRKRKAYDK